MDNKTVFSKTAKGLREASGASSDLPRALRGILKEIDGKSSFSALLEKLRKLSEKELKEALERLENEGYVRDTLKASLTATTPSSLGGHTFVPALTQAAGTASDVDDLDFTSLAPAALTPAKKVDADVGKAREERLAAELRARQEAEAKARQAEAIKVKQLAEAKARQEAEERAKKEVEEKARKAAEDKARKEAEERIRREAEEKIRREAEEKVRKEFQERARREAEERARKEAEEQARREAEVRARKEAEEAARREAEERARKEAEERARREAEERARKEAEEQARREAEERARKEAEEAARREAEERARKEAEEAARREAEERARKEAEEQARREAEERARKEAEERARREAEERARKEAEEAARREAEERARKEAEERARREAEERARKEAEEAARREAEERARKEAEEAARREAEERARKEAEEQARREAEERARKEAEEAARREAEERGRREAEEAARKEAEERARREFEEKERLAAWEASKRKAEEKLRLEAEEKARRDAEERIRIEARERAEREAEERLKEEALALARHEAEERARQQKEARIRQEAEEEVRREEQERARREAEAEAARIAAEKAAEKADRAADRPKVRWKKLIGLVSVPFIGLILGIVPFIPFDGRISDLEQAAGVQFGHPVKIGSVRMGVFPRPHWRYNDVTIGEAGEISIPQVRAVISGGARYQTVEFISPVVKGQAAGWVLLGKAQAAALGTERLRVTDGRFESESITLPGFDAKADVDSDGNWSKFVFEFADRDIYLELLPDNGRVRFDMTAITLLPPLGGTISLDDFMAKGSIDGKGMMIDEFEGRNFGGSLRGSAMLRWDGVWSIEGKVVAKQLDSGKLAPALLKGGRVDGSATFAMQANQGSSLFAQPNVEGSFVIGAGEVIGIDLMHLLANTGNAGKTGFREVKGGYSRNGAVTQLRQMRVDAGILSATGNVELNADGAVRGRFATSYRFDNQQRNGALSLSGTLQEPMFGR